MIEDDPIGRLSPAEREEVQMYYLRAYLGRRRRAAFTRPPAAPVQTPRPRRPPDPIKVLTRQVESERRQHDADVAYWKARYEKAADQLTTIQTERREREARLKAKAEELVAWRRTRR